MSVNVTPAPHRAYRASTAATIVIFQCSLPGQLPSPAVISGVPKSGVTSNAGQDADQRKSNSARYLTSIQISHLPKSLMLRREL